MSTLYQIAFRTDTKSYEESINAYPICDSSRMRVAASLCYRNRAKLIVLMCEQKPQLVWFSRRRKSYPV